MRKGLGVVGFSRAGDVKFHLPQHLGIGVNEGNRNFDGLADTGLRKMLLDSFPIRFVGRFLPISGRLY